MPRIFVCGTRILRLYKSMLKSGRRGLCSIRAIDHGKQEDKRRAGDAPCRGGLPMQKSRGDGRTGAGTGGLSVAEDADGSRMRVESETVSLHASGDGPQCCACAEIRQVPGRCGNGACAR